MHKYSLKKIKTNIIFITYIKLYKLRLMTTLRYDLGMTIYTDINNKNINRILELQHCIVLPKIHNTINPYTIFIYFF